MAIQVVRYQKPGTADASDCSWGVVFDTRVAPIAGDFPTTGDFVRDGLALARAASPAQATLALDALRLRSPVTDRQQFICQGVNYPSHARESGFDPAQLPFNTLFTKASGCITDARADVVRPPHVKLLDYEIELGLVMKSDLRAPRRVSPHDLPELLAGVTIVNDVSARDIQLPQTQFYKGKSYRTFGPVGPYLVLLEPAEWALLPALRMRLDVNGHERQNDLCGSMIYKPHQTLAEISGLHDLHAGDLIATGTPAGCAAKAPNRAAMFVARHLLSDTAKWRTFVARGLANPQYLRPGDEMELSIRTDDGRLDLGRQRNRVVAG